MQSQNTKKQKLLSKKQIIEDNLKKINKRIKRIEDDMRNSQSQDVRFLFNYDNLYLNYNNKNQMYNEKLVNQIYNENYVNQICDNKNCGNEKLVNQNFNNQISKNQICDNQICDNQISNDENKIINHKINQKNNSTEKQIQTISKDDIIHAKEFLFSSRHLPSIYILKNSPKIVFFEDFQNAYHELEITKYFRDIERIKKEKIKELEVFYNNKDNDKECDKDNDKDKDNNYYNNNNNDNDEIRKELMINYSIERYLNNIIENTNDYKIIENDKNLKVKNCSTEEKKKIFSMMKGGNSKIYSNLTFYKNKKLDEKDFTDDNNSPKLPLDFFHDEYFQ
ncbi:hypothetical protein DMUE_0377 [Dictyocoela muelleri]|nr:hypothetical protein DMUE_0377 [Dictyocoela muelleri]